ncbi:hypothetical protein [uncultured Microbulbifer sp.]|uniref:hypothetical protein n=1 Tax=uncultured Microbulbifer sp. TaxID=348147 RepID=UPI0026064644|nr:hypothetical protein [uncultured Microbulbifer sp.]
MKNNQNELLCCKTFLTSPQGKVFTEIAGKVKLKTRISKAFNYSGEMHQIPIYKAQDGNGNDVVQVSSGEKILVSIQGQDPCQISSRSLWLAKINTY